MTGAAATPSSSGALYVSGLGEVDILDVNLARPVAATKGVLMTRIA